MRVLARVSLRLAAALGLLAAILTLAGVLVVRSGWFREQVRARIIAELEKATGGAVQLGQFNFDWTRMNAQVTSLIIRGKEQPGDPPFLSVGSVSLGLRVISAFEKQVDLAEVQVVQPQVHIVVYPDGSTNIPDPGKRVRGKSWSEQLLALKIRRYKVTAGLFEFDQRKLPLNFEGEDLQATMQYDPSSPAYRGEIASNRVRLMPKGYGPIEADLAGTFAIEKTRIVLPRLEVRTAETNVKLDGALEDVRAPKGVLNVHANAGIREVVRTFGLPIGPQGNAAFDGILQVALVPKFEARMKGRVAAKGVGYVRDRLTIQDGTVTADVDLYEDGLGLRNVVAQALDAKFTGTARLDHWRQFHMEGQVAGLDLQRAAGVFTARPVAWTGSLDGPFALDTGIHGENATANANLMVTPGGEGSPVQGEVAIAYDRNAGTVDLGSSWIATPATRVDASGTLGKTLRVKLRTANPDDLLPAIVLAGEQAPTSFPLRLNNGTASAEGSVTGRLENPVFAGKVEIANGLVDGHGFEKLTAAVIASREQISAEQIALQRGATGVTGSMKLAASQGSFREAAVTASWTMRNGNIAEMLREAGESFPAAGIVTATIRVAGTVRNPEADITAEVAQPVFYREPMTRLRAQIRYRPDRVELSGGEAQEGNSSVQFSGVYRKGADWRNGDVTLQMATQRLSGGRLETLAKLPAPVDGVFTGRVNAAGHVENGLFELRDVHADVAADGLTIGGKPVGNLAAGVDTKDGQMTVLATGKLQETAVELRGTWALSGQYPGSGTLHFSRLSLASLHSLVLIGSNEPEPDDPFEGFVEGGATFSGPLGAPREMTAELKLDSVQITPKASQAQRLGVQSTDIVLRNSQPVVLDLTAHGARVRQGVFGGRDTSLEVSGNLPFDDGAGADLNLRGNMNLILLQLYNQDLLARGSAILQTSIRGNIRNPMLNGRLELKGAQLYLNDLPQGVDNANGVIVFDRNRASIEKLTAETGGGTVALSGGVEFGRMLVYRLQGTAQQVRVRWPEDLSTTFNARLTLSGTSEASTLGGTLTLNRAAFNPRTDLGQLLAQASKPVPAPSTPNEYLRGLQFDVRVESGPNFGFETTLTRDVEAEVDLHLQGTPLRPVLLGNISVNQGEVQVFGNRYTIERGEVRFLNPVKIEPSIDMDLSTRARGITVNVSFSGTMQRMKFNYSSDPPLQSSEIIALLTVGRDPLTTVNSTAITSAGRSSLVDAGNGLIGQAVSAQISSRVQRFFGASRVKIDPTLTGVDNLPQARLTLEQQVSRDITLTYITNLNRTQEQLVRVQWDFNRNWSAVAVRDPNGLFGVDFQYRKRF